MTALLSSFSPSDFLPADATWAGVMVVIIIALFVAAAVIGTVARMVMPEKYVEPVMAEAEAGAPVHPVADEH